MPRSSRPRRRLVAPILAAVVALLSLLTAPAVEPFQERWRPQFHFTPPVNWMNDPNGMVYHRGEYHLFYQYNPFGDQWGHMSWGHAVSRDLVRWQDLPVALPETNGIMIFSGSAVVDHGNTSGFGSTRNPPLVAIYTGHREGRQDQRLAYSLDRGRNWTQYPGNPVLDLGLADFRDPKVFWHAPTARWIMVVALSTEKKVQFYASPDLKAWTLTSSFGPAGSSDGLWECPDLFVLPIEGGGTRWVLIVNVNPGGPTGGSGCQYFTGDFDGKTFTPDTPGAAAPRVRWADHGADFYAAVSWSDVPASDGRRIWLGWMSNWQYAGQVPTSPWRGAMTLPRTLALRSTPEGLALVQAPVEELTRLRRREQRFRGGDLAAANAWLAQRTWGDLLEIEVVFDQLGPRSRTGMVLGSALADGEQTRFDIDAAAGRVRLDRTRSGEVEVHPAFRAVHEAPLRLGAGPLRVRALVDTSSIEVFVQDGQVVFTDLIFPRPGGRRLSLTGGGDPESPVVRQLRVWELRPAKR